MTFIPFGRKKSYISPSKACDDEINRKLNNKKGKNFEVIKVSVHSPGIVIINTNNGFSGDFKHIINFYKTTFTPTHFI